MISDICVYVWILQVQDKGMQGLPSIFKPQNQKFHKIFIKTNHSNSRKVGITDKKVRELILRQFEQTIKLRRWKLNQQFIKTKKFPSLKL